MKRIIHENVLMNWSIVLQHGIQYDEVLFLNDVYCRIFFPALGYISAMCSMEADSAIGTK